MLTHSNAFIPKMNEEERQCFDDYADQLFTCDLQIAIRPNAFLSPDIRELENQIHHLIFSYNSYGCINLDKSASFHLAVKSADNVLLYETHYHRHEEPSNVLWDERRLWLDRNAEYFIEIVLDDLCGKTLDFWYWLEESDASFWSDVEMKGFLHCDIDPQVAACFRKGGTSEAVFVSTLDLPSENEDWFDGTCEADLMTADWFSMSIDVYNQGLWDKIVAPALQIAAVNYTDLNPNLSLIEKITDERSTDKAAVSFAEHRIRFYPRIEVSAGNKYLLEKSIREILQLLSETDAGYYSAQTYTGYFYNKKSLYLEIWDFNPDTFELVISHTKPLK
ncbi:MAG: hypothetical protein WCG21_12520 [Eubacteriales bacterium]